MQRVLNICESLHLGPKILDCHCTGGRLFYVPQCRACVCGTTTHIYLTPAECERKRSSRRQTSGNVIGVRSCPLRSDLPALGLGGPRWEAQRLGFEVPGAVPGPGLHCKCRRGPRTEAEAPELKVSFWRFQLEELMCLERPTEQANATHMWTRAHTRTRRRAAPSVPVS